MILSREAKRYVVAVIYFVGFILLLVGVYYAFIKAPETCFDGQQNQNEGGVDCGGVCTTACVENIVGTDLEITETAFVQSLNGQYDILGKIYNPNDEIGASTFSYTAELRDVSGKSLGTRSGTSFILPQENKYVFELNLTPSTPPASVAIRIDDVKWERFSGYQEKPAVNIYQKRYNQISSGAGFGEAYGLLSNESPYDFRSIVVRVILRDANNRPLAFNSTEMRTVKSHEERDFRLVWPSAFPGTVEKVEMLSDVDVYHSDNFMQQYLPGGKFQEFGQPAAY